MWPNSPPLQPTPRHQDVPGTHSIAASHVYAARHAGIQESGTLKIAVFPVSHAAHGNLEKHGRGGDAGALDNSKDTLRPGKAKEVIWIQHKELGRALFLKCETKFQKNLFCYFIPQRDFVFSFPSPKELQVNILWERNITFYAIPFNSFPYLNSFVSDEQAQDVTILCLHTWTVLKSNVFTN